MPFEQIKVIIADDEPAVRDSLAKYLRKNGFDVDTAGDAKQTMELLMDSNGAYDVVILDDIMPDGRGISTGPMAVPLTKEIRALFPNVQIIVISGWGMDSALEVLREGAYRFMAKPFNIAEIIINIKAAIEARKLKEQIDKQHPTNIKILFIAANPVDSVRLRLDEEIRAVDLALLQTEFRDKFDIRQHWAVRASDLQSYLLRHKPNIVHFSGHGSPSSEIMLQDFSGNSRPISNRALSSLFSILKDNIQCVVLNACYSEQQALAIAEHIDCVVGMSKAIGDLSAISFATAFYQALGYGRDVKTAFDLGCMQIDLENLGDEDIPRLLASRKDPKTLTFVSK